MLHDELHGCDLSSKFAAPLVHLVCIELAGEAHVLYKQYTC